MDVRAHKNEKQQVGPVGEVVEYAAVAAQAVYDAATSKRAQRTLIQTTIAGVASLFLLGLATIAYIAFYNAYLPDQVTVLPVHLQYGYEPNPYAVLDLNPPHANILSDQAYSLDLTLSLPRSPRNVDRGNFMAAFYFIDDTPLSTPGAGLQWLSSTSENSAQSMSMEKTIDAGPQSILKSKTVAYTIARPVILPYTDRIASLARRVLFLLLHILWPTKSSTTTISVVMAERMVFQSGHVPTVLVVDLQAGQDLQVYSASVTITAKLSGLRWIMHRWWLTSFTVFIGAFWAVGMGSMVLVWVVLASRSQNKTPVAPSKSLPDRERSSTTQGERHDEDVPMTFPTTSGQQQLKYETTYKFKEETDEEKAGRLAAIPPAGADADDEYDEVDSEGERIEAEARYRGDSGIGTSYSDRDGSNLVRRRSTKGK